MTHITELVTTSYNGGNDVMKQFNILVQVWLILSKAGFGFSYNKIFIQVYLWVAERFNNYDVKKIENIREVSKLVGGRT